MKEILKHIADNYDFYKEIAVKLTKNNDMANDLLNQCIVYCNDKYNKDILLKALNDNTFFSLFTYIMKNEFWSKTSYFYRDYNKYFDKNTELVYNNQTETFENNYDYKDIKQQTMRVINHHLNQVAKQNDVEWWEIECWKEYFLTNQTYRQVGKKVYIAHTTVHTACIKIMNKLNDKLEENGNKRIQM